MARRYDIQEHLKAAENSGYITIPEQGYPGHPDWRPGTRQWIPAGSPNPSELWGVAAGGGEGSSTDTQGINEGEGPGLNYDAVRARAIAPSRAVYQNAIRNLNKQRGLGISSPGYGAQMAKLSRGMSQSMSDASIGAEASVADMMLRDKALNQEAILRNRALNIEEQRLPSGSQQMTSDIQGWLNLASTGAGIYGNIRGGTQTQQKQPIYGGVGIPTGMSGVGAPTIYSGGASGQGGYNL